MSPYYKILGNRPFGFPAERYYVEVDNKSLEQKYKCRRFEKGS